LAAELKQTFPEAQVRLVQSSGGLFEVTVDGQLVFSKKASRRHAAPGEVVQAIQRLRGEK
jgi:selT/selW/selH-like putative selenoprotein